MDPCQITTNTSTPMKDTVISKLSMLVTSSSGAMGAMLTAENFNPGVDVTTSQTAPSELPSQVGETLAVFPGP
jgi:hypothetical protein